MPEPCTVALVKCPDYNQDAVNKAVKQGIELLGGIDRFVKAGEKILLKPNCLLGERPSRAVTTHPAVFRAVAAAFVKTGAAVCYGDSPGFGSPKTVLRKCGLAGPAQSLGIQEADFKHGRRVFFKKGSRQREFKIAAGVLESHGVISLPKFKTHGLEKMTGAVKNQFGCVPGLLKAEYHVKIPDPYDFAAMLVDLDSYINPRLYIMDGIVAMQGNGPRGGEARAVELLLFATDPVALDTVMCRVADLDPMLVPTNSYGSSLPEYTAEFSDIKIIGADIRDFIKTDFKVDRTPLRSGRKRILFKYINNLLLSRPVINKSKCIKCGVCIKVCPVKGKALFFPSGDKNKVPVYDYKKCIRCYCCQELCPESAVSVKKPLLRKFFDSAAAFLRKIFY